MSATETSEKKRIYTRIRERLTLWTWKRLLSKVKKKVFSALFSIAKLLTRFSQKAFSKSVDTLI